MFIFLFILRYYYDSIKVHTEAEKLLLPIHGYPVLNRENIKEFFPKNGLIDFGIIPIGERETYVIYIY